MRDRTCSRANWSWQLEKLSNQARFVKAIVSKGVGRVRRQEGRHRRRPTPEQVPASRLGCSRQTTDGGGIWHLDGPPPGHGNMGVSRRKRCVCLHIVAHAFYLSPVCTSKRPFSKPQHTSRSGLPFSNSLRSRSGMLTSTASSRNGRHILYVCFSRHATESETRSWSIRAAKRLNGKQIDARDPEI